VHYQEQQHLDQVTVRTDRQPQQRHEKEAQSERGSGFERGFNINFGRPAG